jgi:hypothetical protein
MIGTQHHAQFYWLKWGLANFFLRLASNYDPPYLCLLNSWDYKEKQLYLSHKPFLFPQTLASLEIEDQKTITTNKRTRCLFG